MCVRRSRASPQGQTTQQRMTTPVEPTYSGHLTSLSISRETFVSILGVTGFTGSDSALNKSAPVCGLQ